MADQIIQFILAHFKRGSSIVTLDTIGLPQLQLGDKITIGQFAQMGIIDKDFWIININVTYDGGVKMSLTLREVV